MDIRKIKKMIELLEESGVAEIEIREGEESLRIARAIPAAAPAHYIAAPPPPAPAAPAAPPPTADAPARGASPQAAAGEHIVTAPMVGTYYASPAPGAKPFLEIGQEVVAGQVLCIIEAMKMMNQIECEQPGRIKAMLVKNGEPVEFGQPLFIIQ